MVRHKLQSSLSFEDVKFFILVFTATLPLIVWMVRLEGKVQANEQDVGELTEQIREYPSADYFEEKFKGIDSNFTGIKSDVKDIKDRLE